MAHRYTGFMLIALSLLAAGSLLADSQKPAPANGIEVPRNYKTWKLLSVSHRLDKNSIRAILANSVAHRHTGKTSANTWPEGSVIAKLVWKDRTLAKWPDAIVPGAVSHIEFMVKDSNKYANTGGWGFARWVGMELKPYDNDGSECFACHTKVRNSDFVFTQPAKLP